MNTIEAKDTIKVEYRTIAKLMCMNVPTDNTEYAETVEATLESIKALSEQNKLALRIAYIFATKVPFEERQDCFQTFTSTLLVNGTNEPKLAYSIIRGDWLNWWKTYRVKSHIDLDSTVSDDEGNITSLADLIVGEIEFVQRLETEDSAARLWDRIPEDIKPLIVKRLQGKQLTAPRAKHAPIEEPLIGTNRKEYKRFIRRGRPSTGNALTDCERKQFSRWLAKDGYKIALN